MTDFCDEIPSLAAVLGLEEDDAALMMLAPDEYEAAKRDGGLRDDLPGDTVIVMREELRQMLEVLTAVHCCWEDGTLPDPVRGPYLRYSASGGVLDEEARLRMRAEQAAKCSQEKLLRRIRTALPKLAALRLPAAAGAELAAIAALAAKARDDDRAVLQ